MSDAAVYTVLPIVNDPFGKCFVVPAMIACTCAKAAALVLFDVVLDMYVSLLSEGSAKDDAASPSEPECPAGSARLLRGPHMDTLAPSADSAPEGRKSTWRVSISTSPRKDE